MTSKDVGLTRRQLLSSGAALVVACHLPLASGQPRNVDAGANASLKPNAFVRVDRNNVVTVVVRHIEMGQGTFTGLSSLVAEEMDAAWDQLRAVHAPANDAAYGSPMMGGFQATGGSMSMASSFQTMRQAGATARAMLVNAAAEIWRVDASSITVADGIVSAGGQRRADFGTLAPIAAHQPVPKDVQLKSPDQFKIIGKPLPKLDSVEKSTGRARFTQDVYRREMLTVLVEHPPSFGAKYVSGNLDEVRRLPGVDAVEVIPEGVAVYGESFWQAKKARDALKLEWDEGDQSASSSDKIVVEYRELSKTPGLSAASRGDVDQALANAATRVEALYEFPFLAHAPMEPLDGVLEMRDGAARIWLGAQSPTFDQRAVAGVLGIPPEKVTVETMLAGGSFGRRAEKRSEFATELANTAKAIGGRRPVKLVWTREDDIRGGAYRPLYVHRMKGGLDSAGNIAAWQQTLVGQSVQAGGPFEPFVMRDGIDITSVEGAADLPYAIDNLSVSLHSPTLNIPVLWWRSVGHTHTAFAAEAFVDELLHEAGEDPVAGRLALLSEDDRRRGVLERVAKAAGWSGPKAEDGAAFGVAVHKSFGSFVAQIAKVRVVDRGTVKVEKVWCAVDCGLAVNPDVVVAQMEGGIGFGLGAALHGQLDIANGRVQQGNFDTYRQLRLPEMPDIEVHIVNTDNRPTGVGEPGLPPIAPAVANALFQITGTRVRRLPFGQVVT